MVDQETRLEKTVAYNQLLQYRYTLISISSRDLNPELVRPKLRDFILKKGCGEVKKLLDAGITLEYLFFGSDGNHIISEQIRPNACDSHRPENSHNIQNLGEPFALSQTKAHNTAPKDENSAFTEAATHNNKKKNDQNYSELVKEIQKLLLKNGSINEEPDGIYGPKTKAAIKSYQKKMGLTPNGRVSEELLVYMRMQNENTSTSKLTQNKMPLEKNDVPEKKAISGINKPDLNMHTQGDTTNFHASPIVKKSPSFGLANKTQSNQSNVVNLIYEIQKNLNKLGYLLAKPNGVYGSETNKAILSYQRDFMFKQDGLATESLSRHLKNQADNLKAVPPKNSNTN